LRQESNDNIEKLFNIVYSGIGKINATIAAMNVLKLYPSTTTIINFGTAGGRPELAGKVVRCSSFYQRDMNCSPLGFENGITPYEEHLKYMAFSFPYKELQDIPTAVCASGDSFYTKNKFTDFDVVDMESYAIAKVCHVLDISFISFKYITDSGDEKSAYDWRENVHHSSNQFLPILEKIKRSNIL
jgi:adenosylhomocysteine nucleosidase